MKNISTAVLAFFLLFSQLFAQNIPTGINYQAAARNSSGEIIANNDITAEINLYSGDDTNILEYREIHQCTSNDYGIFNLTIGEGIPTNDGITNDFGTIDWLNGEYTLQVRADFGTDEFLNGLKEMGSYRILSVPYALTSKRALTADSLTGNISLNLEQLNNVNIPTPLDMQVIAWDETNQQWIATDPGGIPDIFVRTDGTSDLTGDWNISNNSIGLENGSINIGNGVLSMNTGDISLNTGNITISNGSLSSATLSGNTGTAVTEFSTDIAMTDSSTLSVPTESAVKAYVDNVSLTTAWNHNSSNVFMRTEKNLGIGTNEPIDKFELLLQDEQGFLVRGDFGGNIPSLGAGTRMCFYPAKGAFRAGRVENNSTYWDDNYVGAYSAAFGYDGNANGDYSFSAGRENVALSNYSTAFGRNNQAVNSYSFSVGKDNSSSALYSITMGNNNTATGNTATAIGIENTARGDYSLSCGYQTQTGSDAGTGGQAAFASGDNTTAEGNASAVTGKNNLIKGDYSFAAGENNYIPTSGNSASAFGKSNIAEGEFSTVFGTNCTSESYAETVFGQYNHSFGGSNSSWDTDDSAFSIGNGTDALNHSNAFIVMKNGNTGVGTGTTSPTVLFQVGTNGDGTIAEANAWNTFSDIRLKKNITKIDSVSEKLAAMNGYYFYWKKGKDTSRQIGVIAQETEKIFPELVYTDKKGFMSVNYPMFTAILIEANNNQEEKIEKLAKEIIDLKLRIENSERKIAEIQEYIRAQANIKMIDE